MGSTAPVTLLPRPCHLQSQFLNKRWQASNLQDGHAFVALLRVTPRHDWAIVRAVARKFSTIAQPWSVGTDEVPYHSPSVGQITLAVQIRLLWLQVQYPESTSV